MFRVLISICFLMVFIGCGGSGSKSVVNEATSVAVSATNDAMSGVNLKLNVTGFTFTPENVNGSNVSKEGHAHLYVDGVKIGRVYGEYFYLGHIEDGMHDIKVELNNNDHSIMQETGAEVNQTVSFHVQNAGGGHMHSSTKKNHGNDSHEIKNFSVDVHQDAKSGYNLQLKAEGFTLDPENVNGANVEGHGHAHLYVNGEKVTRIYTEWYHLTGLAAGDNAIKIVLSNNDHTAMTDADGKELAYEFTVHSDGSIHTHSH